MADLMPTFAFEDDTVLAFFENRVIAKGPDFEKVEKTALDYLDSLGQERSKKARETAKQKATHIVSPNGVKGEILSNVEGQWGERQITVRFENGTFAKLEAHGGNDDGIEYIHEEPAVAGTPIEGLQALLDAEYEHDKGSLASRVQQLDQIALEAATMNSRGSSLADEERLNKIALSAAAEKLEVKEALDHLEQADIEAFQPPAPFSMGVAEQADLGRGKGDNWLDRTVQDMIDESEGQDLDQLLRDGPTQFASELESGALADAGVTRDMAYAHITSKTAGFAGEEVETYRDQFVAATEQARRRELAVRTETTKREAAAQQEEELNVPDEALFMR